MKFGVLGFRVWGLVFRIWDLGSWVQSLGLKFWALLCCFVSSRACVHLYRDVGGIRRSIVMYASLVEHGPSYLGSRASGTGGIKQLGNTRCFQVLDFEFTV